MSANPVPEEVKRSLDAETQRAVEETANAVFGACGTENGHAKGVAAILALVNRVREPLEREREALKVKLRGEEERHAALQARCYEGFASASDGIFDALNEADRSVAALEEENRRLREPVCKKCGLTKGCLIHSGPEFTDDEGAEDCHKFDPIGGSHEQA